MSGGIAAGLGFLRLIAPLLSGGIKIAENAQEASAKADDKKAGADAAVVQQQKGTIDAIQTGLDAARDQSVHDADHDRLHEDDGFKRPSTRGSGQQGSAKPKA